MVTGTAKCSVLVKVTITLECSAPLMVTINHKYSVLLMGTHSEVFSAHYAHCHSALFSAPYGHCHSAPYRHSAVVMTIPGSRTASRQYDAAASHFCHLNTVLYPRSYSQCQLPLNRSHRYITGAAFSDQNFSSHNIIFIGTSADLSIYISFYIIYHYMQSGAMLLIC